MLSRWPAHSRFTSLTLVILVLTANIGRALLARSNIEPSPEFKLIFGIALSFTIAYWLDRDNRATNLIRAWEKAWFFFIAWPVVLPYYLVRTRGAKKAMGMLLAWLGVSVLLVFSAGLAAAIWSK